MLCLISTPPPLIDNRMWNNPSRTRIPANWGVCELSKLRRNLDTVGGGSAWVDRPYIQIFDPLCLSLSLAQRSGARFQVRKRRHEQKKLGRRRRRTFLPRWFEGFSRELWRAFDLAAARTRRVSFFLSQELEWGEEKNNRRPPFTLFAFLANSWIVRRRLVCVSFMDSAGDFRICFWERVPVFGTIPRRL